MNTDLLLTQLKTKLEGLSWSTPSSDDPTSFVGGVYTAPKLTGGMSSPWCYLMDQSPTITKTGSRGKDGDLVFRKQTPIAFNICVDKNDDIIAFEGLLKRLRYASEALETQIMKDGVYLFNTLGLQGANYTGFNDFFNESNNVYTRRLILQVISTI